MIQPKCSKDIGGLNRNTPDGCENKLPPFSIVEFLKTNHELFTVYGVIGAMLALLPTFATSFLGSDWTSKLIVPSFYYLPLFFLEFAIFSGSIFMIIIAIQILSEVTNYERNSYREIFLITFTPTIIAPLYFILSLFLFQRDLTISYSVLIVIVSMFSICWVYLVVIWISKFNISNIRKIFLCIICFSLVIGVIIGLAYPLFFQPDPKLDISLKPGSSNYTPINSSNIGNPLILSTEGTLGSFFYYNYSVIHWSTNYGYFISKGSEGINDSMIKIEGQNFVTSKISDVFWTYDSKDLGIKKPATKIFVQVEDSRNKNILAKAQLNSTWVDIDNIIFAP